MRHSCWADDGEGGFENTGWICNPFCEYDPKTTRAIPGSCQSLGPSTKQQKYDPFGYGSGFRNGPYTCRPNEQCLCGDEGPDSDDPENCKLTDNPNYGVNNFDNIFWASVTIFQSITLEGWVDIMYQVMDGSGLMSCWFFIVAVIMGAYIVINLFLAVLCDNFNMADSDGPEEEKVDGEQLVARAAAKLKHNNLNSASVFVTAAGDWKLAGLEYVCGTEAEPGSKILPSLEKYDPPERKDPSKARLEIGRASCRERV